MSVAARFEANASEDLSSPFYFNASHWRAMDGVVEGVKSREGIMVLTGPTGSGKTMLMRAISDNLGEGAIPLFLQYASLNFREFVNFLHNSLKVGDEVLDASNKAIALRKFLYSQAERRETAVVFIDEAQNLEPDVLRMLPKLACFDQLEDGTNVGLQFMLTGGSELRELLGDSDFEEVQGAVAREYELRFFTRGELKYFLEKRLAPLARLTPEPITDTAIEAVGKYTGGSPRLIGMICSHAMLFAAENPGRSIDEAMIEEAAEALMIEPVENPFPDEDDGATELSGPFSSADLQGGDRSYESDVESTFGADISDDAASSTMEEIEAPMTTQAFEDQHAEDQDVFSSILDEDLDSHHMEPIANELDDFESSDDQFYTDELDDTDYADGDNGVATKVAGAAAVAGVAGAVASKGGSALSRVKSALSNRKSKGAGKQGQIVGASRKGGGGERDATPTEKRALKTRVVGQRKKQIKYAAMAAGVCALAFGAYTVRTDVTKAIASATDAVGSTASKAVETVSAAGSKAVDAVGSTASQATDAISTASSRAADAINTTATGASATGAAQSTEVAALNVNAPVTGQGTQTAIGSPAPVKKGGWGARVNVGEDSGFNVDAKLPEAGVGIARGALDLLDSALDKSKDILPEEMTNAIDIAKGDVQNLRTAAAANGAEGEELTARVNKLIEKGDLLFERKLYIAPAGRNAYDTYRSVLDIDPNNEAALQGVEKLRAFYSQKAEAARAKKQWDTANRFFETALGISQRRSVR